jgi:hypothetical protein
MRLLPAASAAVVVAVGFGILATPVAASAYPSWSDVQAAKGNADATKTQVQAITGALTTLQQTAAARSEAAVKAQGASEQAQAKLAAATSAAQALDTQYKAEQKKASIAHQEAGQLAARLYRVGDSASLDGQLFTGRDASGTLYKLGALSQLTAQWQTVLDQATVTSKAVSSLGAQASVAAHERDVLAGQATTALAAAQSAQQTANTEVADATAHQKTLYAQLASLNNTTATIEKQYNQGQIALAAIRAQQAAKAAAEQKAQQDREAAAAAAAAANNPPASNNGGGGGGGTDSGGGSTPPPPTGGGVIDDPAGAQAYASSVLPSHGWASSQFSCLVLLWNQESGWRTSALNVSSGAYGIPQSLPANKMSVMGLDWQTNYRTQINWGLAYIAGAYGSPCGAWAHEVAHNWY